MKMSNGALAIFGAMIGSTLMVFDASAAAARPVVEKESAYAVTKADSPQWIDDAALCRAAKAYVKLTQIETQRKELLNGADRDGTRERISRQIESEKLSALKSEQLQPPEYNRILKKVESNSVIRQKFLAYVDAATVSAKSKRLWQF